MSAFDAYVQAAFHGGTMAAGPTFTVVHDAETPLDYGYCDAIAEFFRKGPKAGTSAHAMVGPEKAIKLLPDNVVAWAAGPYANPRGWHLEQTGYARFTRPQWITDKGLAQINRSGACLREVHDTWAIPKRWCTDDQLRRAAKGDRSSGGMTTHQQVARVLGGTTHTDPEDNYPRDLLLQAVLDGDDDAMPFWSEWPLEEKNAFGEWLKRWVLQEKFPELADIMLRREFPKRGPGATGKTSLETEIGWLPSNLASVGAAASGSADLTGLRSLLVEAVREGMAADNDATADEVVDRLAARLGKPA